MSLPSDDILRELELLPMWISKVAQAPSPAATATETTKGHKQTLIQGVQHRGYLPHIKAEGGIYFVTFRLADSLPSVFLVQLESIPVDDRNAEIESQLNLGHGACWLKQEAIASIVKNTLLARNGEDYQLHAWVIMPNHVHLVIEPLGNHALSDILQAIKSTSAHLANVALERSGAFWQRESFDHLIRDDSDFERCCHYVRENPVTATLAPTAEQYLYSDVSAADSDASAAAVSKTNAGEGACATDSSDAVPPNLNRSLLDKTIGEVRRDQIMQLDWQSLQHCVHECTSCHLSAGRTQTVFGSGDLQADWLLVGDAPSIEDDFSGEPFSGEVGQLLDNMLAAIKLKRHDKVYLSHAIHCKPPENRKPLPDEVALCAPYLQRQVALIQPKVIIAFGAVAAESLLNSQQRLTELRGQAHHFLGIPVIVTHHPAHLLQHPQDKAQAWSDLCLAVNTMQGLQI